MIERLRTVHDKVGAPALFRLGGLLGGHVTACGFDDGFGLYGKWHFPLGLGRWMAIDQFHERAFLLFQSKVQIYKVRIVGLVSSGRQYRGVHQGYYSGLLF
jgi:hypothetical protein